MGLLERAWNYLTAPEKVQETSGVVNQITGAIKSMISGTLGNAYNRSKEAIKGVGSIIARTASAVKNTISLNPLTVAGALAMTPINTVRASVDIVGDIANGVGKAVDTALNEGILTTYDHLAMGTKNAAKKITLADKASNSGNIIAKAYGKTIGTAIDLVGPSHLPTNLTRSAIDNFKKGATKEA